MPAVSPQQQRLFGAVLAYKHGENPSASKAVRKIAETMSEEQIRHYAATAVSKRAAFQPVTGKEQLIAEARGQHYQDQPMSTSALIGGGIGALSVPALAAVMDPGMFKRDPALMARMAALTGGIGALGGAGSEALGRLLTRSFGPNFRRSQWYRDQDPHRLNSALRVAPLGLAVLGGRMLPALMQNMREQSKQADAPVIHTRGDGGVVIGAPKTSFPDYPSWLPSLYPMHGGAAEFRLHGGGANPDWGLNNYQLFGEGMHEPIHAPGVFRFMDNATTKQVRKALKGKTEIFAPTCNLAGGGCPEWFERLAGPQLNKVTMTPPGNLGMFGYNVSKPYGKFGEWIRRLGGSTEPVSPMHNYIKVDGKWQDSGEYVPLVDKFVGDHWKGLTAAGVLGLSGLVYAGWRNRQRLNKQKETQNMREQSKGAAAVLPPDIPISADREPYPSELEFFKKNPNVAGMAAEDDKVILNPFSTHLSSSEKESVVTNERARIKMRQGTKPDFLLTPEQQRSFQGYGGEQDIRETIAARILSGDPSGGNVTPQQRAWVEKHLSAPKRIPLNPASTTVPPKLPNDWKGTNPPMILNPPKQRGMTPHGPQPTSSVPLSISARSKMQPRTGRDWRLRTTPGKAPPVGVDQPVTAPSVRPLPPKPPLASVLQSKAAAVGLGKLLTRFALPAAKGHGGQAVRQMLHSPTWKNVTSKLDQPMQTATNTLRGMANVPAGEKFWSSPFKGVRRTLKLGINPNLGTWGNRLVTRPAQVLTGLGVASGAGKVYGDVSGLQEQIGGAVNQLEGTPLQVPGKAGEYLKDFSTSLPSWLYKHVWNPTNDPVTSALNRTAAGAANLYGRHTINNWLDGNYNPQTFSGKLREMLMHLRAPVLRPIERSMGGGAVLDDPYAEMLKQYQTMKSSSFHPFIKAADELQDKLLQAQSKVKNNPSEREIDSGCYSKGHYRVQGLDITIETAAGQTRRGVNKATGKEWSVVLKNAYGYIKGTDSAEPGDQMDVFIGPNPSSEIVFVVDQNKADGVTFDEAKVILGCTTSAEAKKLYMDNYSPGWKGFRDITPLTISQFKSWLKNGDVTQPLAGQQFVDFHKSASLRRDDESKERQVAAKPGTDWLAAGALAAGGFGAGSLLGRRAMMPDALLEKLNRFVNIDQQPHDPGAGALDRSLSLLTDYSTQGADLMQQRVLGGLLPAGSMIKALRSLPIVTPAHARWNPSSTEHYKAFTRGPLHAAVRYFDELYDREGYPNQDPGWWDRVWHGVLPAGEVRKQTTSAFNDLIKGHTAGKQPTYFNSKNMEGLTDRAGVDLPLDAQTSILSGLRSWLPQNAKKYPLFAQELKNRAGVVSTSLGKYRKDLAAPLNAVARNVDLAGYTALGLGGVLGGAALIRHWLKAKAEKEERESSKVARVQDDDRPKRAPYKTVQSALPWVGGGALGIAGISELLRRGAFTPELQNDMSDFSRKLDMDKTFQPYAHLPKDEQALQGIADYAVQGNKLLNHRFWGLVSPTGIIKTIRSLPGLADKDKWTPASQQHYDAFEQSPVSGMARVLGELSRGNWPRPDGSYIPELPDSSRDALRTSINALAGKNYADGLGGNRSWNFPAISLPGQLDSGDQMVLMRKLGPELKSTLLKQPGGDKVWEQFVDNIQTGRDTVYNAYGKLTKGLQHVNNAWGGANTALAGIGAAGLGGYGIWRWLENRRKQKLQQRQRQHA